MSRSAISFVLHEGQHQPESNINPRAAYMILHFCSFLKQMPCDPTCTAISRLVTDLVPGGYLLANSVSSFSAHQVCNVTFGATWHLVQHEICCIRKLYYDVQQSILAAAVVQSKLYFLICSGSTDAWSCTRPSTISIHFKT